MDSVIIDSTTLAGITTAVVTVFSVLANFLPDYREKEGVSRFLLKTVNFFAANIKVKSLK